ncbi:hypothetical protein QBC35DRAFT_184724 [Podospora australis]|uniref:Kelch repeat protein n=1 Tax=Podospora australis TaxID=1536484 RepID=A0AAN6WW52_9PEZI|nr:hypothetical protein QBC35DRAFT_184724 [Podospora australis]
MSSFYSSGRFALGCLILAQGVRSDDVPTVENFLRRSIGSATLLGNYVYIDGGEILHKGAGQQALPVNSTLSIDMSESWTTSDVVIRSIPKPGPHKGGTTVWTNEKDGEFYSWGGKWPYGINMSSTTDLWKFKADGKGGGEWSVQPPKSPNVFNELHPTENAAFTNNEDTGFHIGGWVTQWTDKRHKTDDQPVPGMITFNMRTKEWQNGTVQFSPFGRDVAVGGSAHYISRHTFNAPDGLVMVLGGSKTTATSFKRDWDAMSFFDLDNPTFFDPGSMKSFTQKTVGKAFPPGPRAGFCLTGFRTADFSGYDLFLYGGFRASDGNKYNDAWVLTLPAFVWHRVDDAPGGGREWLNCIKVGNGQVLSIGGTNGTFTNKDPAPNGLQLFDMSTLRWTDSYNANDNTYERADAIKQIYTNWTWDDVDWSPDGVQEMFSNAAPSKTPEPSSDSQGSTPVGAIVGGVVGGVAAIAIIGFLVWFLLRRRRRNRHDSIPLQEPDSPARGGGYSDAPQNNMKLMFPQEMGGNQVVDGYQEAPGVGKGSYAQQELDGQAVTGSYELQSGQTQQRGPAAELA